MLLRGGEPLGLAFFHAEPLAMKGFDQEDLDLFNEVCGGGREGGGGRRGGERGEDAGVFTTGLPRGEWLQWWEWSEWGWREEKPMRAHAAKAPHRRHL